MCTVSYTHLENPQADFWFGGTIEPHLQAAELGLLESYRSPLQKAVSYTHLYITITSSAMCSTTERSWEINT